MTEVQRALNSAVSKLSDQHYEQSFIHFRLWFGIGLTYFQTSSDLALNSIHGYIGSTPSDPHCDFIYQTPRLVLRLINDIESDPTLAPHNAGLRSRFCARILQIFFQYDLLNVHSSGYSFSYLDTNLIAHCANLGYLEDETIRDHILQSLISHDKLYDHQAIALVILFKIAGATFAAYTDPAVVDRCFELLKNHGRVRRKGWSEQLKVSTFFVQKCRD